MTNKEKGIYQVRRINADLRGPESRFEDAEVQINQELIELQQNNNIEIIDVIDLTQNKSCPVVLIKYWDYGLNN
jgi:hypothetical protein